MEVKNFVDLLEISRAMRTISAEGCEVLGQGSRGKVLRLDADSIVKLYLHESGLEEAKEEQDYARKAFVMKVMGLMTALTAAALLLSGCGQMSTGTQQVSQVAEPNVVTAEGQKMEVAGVRNARDLGGYRTQDGRTVKRGLLLRTGELGEATPEELKQLIENYHVSHVIDLRSSSEIASNLEPVLSGVTQHALKIMDEERMKKRYASVKDVLSDPQADQITRIQACIESGLVSDQMYVEYLQDEQGKESYREFFRILLDNEPDQAVLWHCTNGKDRTGVAAMLVLSALNVDEETIMADYMLTNEFFADELSAMRSNFESVVQDEKLLDDMLVATRGVSERYMRNVMTYLKDNYGSVVEYLKTEIGLSDDDLAKLKELYTQS